MWKIEGPVAPNKASNPIHLPASCLSAYTLHSGETNPVLHLIFWKDESPFNVPATSLSALMDYRAYSIGPEDPSPVRLELTSEEVDDGRCGFWEVDADILPGIYKFQISATLPRLGYSFVYLDFPGALPVYLKIHNVDYDRHDQFALGLETWIRSNCHENLTSGLRNSMPAVLRPLLKEWLTLNP
jgi:hypothetical protein